MDQYKYRFIGTLHCMKWMIYTPESKVYGVNMGPIWGRLDPSGPHLGPMNFGTTVSISVLEDM